MPKKVNFVEWESIDSILEKVDILDKEDTNKEEIISDKTDEKKEETNVVSNEQEEVITEFVSEEEPFYVKEEKSIDNFKIFLNIDKLEEIDVLDLINKLYEALDEKLMVVDKEKRNVVSVSVDNLFTNFKFLLSDIYKKVNETVKKLDQEFSESKKYEIMEETKLLLRNVEYLLKVLLAEVDFISAEDELSTNYYVARVWAKLKTTSTYVGKGDITFEAMKRDEYCIKTYKSMVIKKLKAYLESIIWYANQSYFLIKVSKD